MTEPGAQAQVPERLTMRAFWRDLADEAFSLERGLPATAWRMLAGPGRLVSDYLVHRPKTITRPFRFFLVGVALFALALAWTGAGEAFESGYKLGADRGDMGRDQAQASWRILGHGQWWLALLVLPAFAASLQSVFRRDAPNFAEMWVLCLFVAGQALWQSAILLCLASTWPVLAWLLPLPLLVGLPATAAGYFGGRAAGRWLRALAALALGLLLAMAMLFAALMLAVAASGAG